VAAPAHTRYLQAHAFEQLADLAGHGDADRIRETDFVRLGFGGSYALNDNFELLPSSPVPEPATLALVATGLAGTMGMAWLKRRKKQSVS
jgi:hypothetical protein